MTVSDIGPGFIEPSGELSDEAIAALARLLVDEAMKDLEDGDKAK